MSDIYLDPSDDTTWIDNTPTDSMGNPLVRINGCPNCGKGAGWVNPITYGGMFSNGSEPDPPCSRACRLQAEHAAMLAARDTEKATP
jgi:hypothetical protein